MALMIEYSKSTCIVLALSYCIYFSCCYEKILDRNNLKERKACLGSQFEYIMEGKSQGQELEVTLHSQSESRERWMVILSSVSPFYLGQDRTFSYEKNGLTTSQGFVYLVILDPFKILTNISQCTYPVFLTLPNPPCFFSKLGVSIWICFPHWIYRIQLP